MLIAKTLQVAKSILPSPVKHWLYHAGTDFLFGYLRKIGLLKLGKFLGFFACDKIVELNKSNFTSVLGSYKDLSFGILTECGEAKAATCDGDHQLDCLRSSYPVKTESILLEAIDSEFSFRNNYVLDQELNVLTEDRSEDLNKILPPPIYNELLEEPTKLDGTVVYLSDPNPVNYFHWMCRVLPLLQIYRRFYGLEIQDIDAFYVGRFNSRNFHKESFKRLGISETKLIQNACKADKLVAAIVNKSTECGESLSKDSYLFTRNLFLANISVSSNHSKPRIYVERGLTAIRKIINEDEIIQLLKKYGFRTVSMDGKAIQEQATLFSQAEAIVAVHGAALTNLLFIQPGTKVIELMPYGYTHNCFHIIANYGQADYFCLQSEATAIENCVDRRCLNLYIDPQKLDTLCQTVFCEKHGVAYEHSVG
jgi:hypothetical protein